MVSWFIMPWEAARVSMEAQRMIAAQFFGFAFPGSQAEDARHGEKNSERNVRNRDNDSVNCQDSTSASQPTRKAVAARSSAHVTKRTTATRRRKSRAGKGKGAR